MLDQNKLAKMRALYARAVGSSSEEEARTSAWILAKEMEKVGGLDSLVVGASNLSRLQQAEDRAALSEREVERLRGVVADLERRLEKELSAPRPSQGSAPSSSGAAPVEGSSEWVHIFSSLYDSACRTCGKVAPVGSDIYWKRGEGVRHAECHTKSQVKPKGRRKGRVQG